jgi:hypothetical protein
LLTLEKMGAVNLDKSWRKMEMNSSSGERNNGENGDELELQNGDALGWWKKI